MTTQTYLTEMQSLNSTGQSVKKIEVGYQVQSQASNPLQGQVKALPAHTIIQSGDPQYASPLFTVSIGEHNGEATEGIPIHHGGGQVIYQSQPSYAEYVQQMPAVYTTITGGGYYDVSGATTGQIVSHGGNSFVVQGASIDGEAPGLANTFRASPATVQWLLENYETAEGVSLPRSTLYTHYMRHCQELRLDPMNPASFGKLIRSVFMGLRTRRLGTRGNSQYHYYGIRIKSMSSLNQFNNDQSLVSRQHGINPAKRFKSDMQHQQDTSNSATESSPASQQSTPAGPGSNQPQPSSAQLEHQQFLGDPSSAIPEFGHVDLPPDQPLPNGITRDHINAFELLYRDHCESFLEIVVSLQFPLIEMLWVTFWRKSQAESDCDDEQKLPKEKLFALCELPAVSQYMLRSDYAFYQALVQVLIPDVLRPIPSVLTQTIRTFGKSLEGWLRNALVGVPEIMIETKIRAVSAFAQILRRYTSLNHLAQAARAVLLNSAQITQMLTDINKVDFTNIQEQASWVCKCDDTVIHKLEQDFKRTLQQQTSLEQWAAWLEGVVNQALGRYTTSPDFAKAARQFLLKWSFYSSMIIRDLTLRSAASFGSFHLIRLLYDEYMFYLVEHKVAAASGQTCIAVMGEARQMADFETFSYNGDMGTGSSLLSFDRLNSGTSNNAVTCQSLQISSAPPPVGYVNTSNALSSATVVTLAQQQQATMLPTSRPTLKVVSTNGSTHHVALVAHATSGTMPQARTVVVLPASAITTSGSLSGTSSSVTSQPTAIKLVRSERV